VGGSFLHRGGFSTLLGALIRGRESLVSERVVAGVWGRLEDYSYSSLAVGTLLGRPWLNGWLGVVPAEY
jgi:hypothetical protein